MPVYSRALPVLTHSHTNQIPLLRTRLRNLLRLETDWDSYGAAPLDWHILHRVEQFVADIMRQGVPLPDLVPSSSGSIIAEWRHNTGLLEVELHPEHEDLVWLEELGEVTLDYEGPIEGIRGRDRTRLEAFLTRLAAREMGAWG